MLMIPPSIHAAKNISGEYAFCATIAGVRNMPLKTEGFSPYIIDNNKSIHLLSHLKKNKHGKSTCHFNYCFYNWFHDYYFLFDKVNQRTGKDQSEIGAI